ncbi:hypothetical protein ROHU_026328 [Labeo rohita]|uniref:Uncharacterized protein n=1 Tax=Labeo rohita TaxID=84645 RepID=A0A498MFP0_LABRO|nr:hypothetical protein ROHU_026328 [Labeo rohita]
MWLTAGVVASLGGIGRAEERRCESEGRRAREQRGARGPSVTDNYDNTSVPQLEGRTPPGPKQKCIRLPQAKESI